MNDVMSVQLAISRLQMHSLSVQEPSSAVATEALAELNTALAELEATNDELQRSNDVLAQITTARDLEARRYRGLFEQIPVACIVTDVWGVIEEANKAADELFSVSTGLLLGKPISVFVAPAERRQFRHRLNKVPSAEIWEVDFLTRARERITVQLFIGVIPGRFHGDRRLCWVIHNPKPQRATASPEKLLTREIALRMEAHAILTRLRALHVGLEQLAHDEHLAIPTRVLGFLESLVPRFAQQMSCQFPGVTEPVIEVGDPAAAAHTIGAPIYGRERTPGRLIARRSTQFTAEDTAILVSAANAITALICSATKTP
ncbi:MAG TPA: PAS domain-containing protein [Longimicrobiales bacterium]